MATDAFKNKDWNEGISAAIGTVAFVQGIRQALGFCRAVDAKSANWTTLDSIVKTIENPATAAKVIGKDIIMNDKDITQELSASFDAWRSGDYYTFGKDLGMTLRNSCKAEEQTLFLY